MHQCRFGTEAASGHLRPALGYDDPARSNVIGGTILDPIAGTCTPDSNLPQDCIEVLDDEKLRFSVGASILWTSPLGPVRFEYAIALSKEEGVWRDGVRVGGDRTQAFRSTGGTRF